MTQDSSDFKKPSPFWVFVSFTLQFMSWGFTNTIFPQYLLVKNGNNISAASKLSGQLTASQSVAAFVTAAGLGILSDRFGRKPFIIMAVISNVFLNIAVLWLPSTFFYFIAYILNGAMNCMIAMSFGYVADVTEPAERSKMFGMMGIGFGVAFGGAPLLAGYLAEKSILLPFIIALCILCVDMVYSLFIPESKPREKFPFSVQRLNPFRSFWVLTKKKMALGLAIVYWILNTAEMGFVAILVLYYKFRFQWSSEQIGLAMSIGGWCYILSQGVVLRLLLPKLGERKCIVVGIAINAVTILGYPLVTKGWMLYPIMVVRTLSLMSEPIIQGFVSRQYSAEQQGEILGVFSALKTIGAIFGPLIFSNIFSYFIVDPTVSSAADQVLGPGLVFFLVSFFDVVCIAICLYLFCTIPVEKDDIVAVSKLTADGVLVPVVADEEPFDPERPPSIDDERRGLLSPTQASIN